MSKNPYGVIGKSSMEWGKKARKREDQQRGLSHRADRESIAEQVAELDDPGWEQARFWAGWRDES